MHHHTGFRRRGYCDTAPRSDPRMAGEWRRTYRLAHGTYPTSPDTTETPETLRGADTSIPLRDAPLPGRHPRHNVIESHELSLREGETGWGSGWVSVTSLH